MLSFANALSTWDLFCTNILHILSKYNLSSLLMANQRSYLSWQICILDLPFKHSYSLNAIKCGTIILVSFLLTFTAKIQTLCSVVSKIATIYWGVYDSHFCSSLPVQLTDFLRKWALILSPFISSAIRKLCICRGLDFDGKVKRHLKKLLLLLWIFVFDTTVVLMLLCIDFVTHPITEKFHLKRTSKVDYFNC